MTNPPDGVPELEARIAELERALDRRRPRRSWLRSRVLIVGVLLATVMSTGIVLASHQFTDVPDDHIFHTDIGRIADAGITAGCTETTFCPEDGMTRGQMAGFLSRALGRAARDSQVIPFADIVAGDPIVELTIKTGGVPGGTGFVLVTATAAVQASEGVCPCDVGVTIKRGTGDFSPSSVVVARTQIQSGWWVGESTLTWLFEAPSGTTQTIQLQPQSITWEGGTENSFVRGMMTAVYIPFGPDGGSTLPAIGPAELPPAIVPDR